jgi:hypothetical protein
MGTKQERVRGNISYGSTDSRFEAHFDVSRSLSSSIFRQSCSYCCDDIRFQATWDEGYLTMAPSAMQWMGLDGLFYNKSHYKPDCFSNHMQTEWIRVTQRGKGMSEAKQNSVFRNQLSFCFPALED